MHRVRNQSSLCRRVARRLFSAEKNTGTTDHLIHDLSQLDTASLCDADKSLLSSGDIQSYHGLRLMEGLRALNGCKSATMVGVARTVQCTHSNDFLAVLRGLAEAESGEVLVINTMESTRAVAGELFCAEASRKGVCGILVDGPMRDTDYLENFASVRCYARLVTPYSGTIQSVGETQVDIRCGGVLVRPGDILVGDNDGIVVGGADVFARILEIAQGLQKTEKALMEGMDKGLSLHSMTNYKEHLQDRAAGKASSLAFRIN